jgi:hypothetical protein
MGLRMQPHGWMERAGTAVPGRGAIVAAERGGGASGVRGVDAAGVAGTPPVERGGLAAASLAWDALRRLAGRTLVTRQRRAFRVDGVRDDRVIVVWVMDDRRRSVARRHLEAAWARRAAGEPLNASGSVSTLVAALVAAVDEEIHERV